ncbi:unnamed protein product [Adineta ricciae]|uniref:Globin-sensor domain-containing protein n=1 Tax=Adineta ricciae TaxID=249248 RepID=A0A813VRE3_ADIRI|nr:unnamed protein product [Adineta ricciae]
MTEHIDKTRLLTDIRYRFNYLSKFLHFTRDDIGILNEISKIILPLTPVIVDTIYRKLFSFDITKQYLLLRHCCSDSHSNDTNFYSDAIEFRKNMLGKYLHCVFTQKEWDDSFLEYLSYIGKIHTFNSGSPLIHVDFIHINALCGFLQSILIDTLCKSENVDQNLKQNGIQAIIKFFSIQTDFMRIHYE